MARKTRKPTGRFNRGRVQTIRVKMKIVQTTTYQRLGVPVAITSKLLALHTLELERLSGPQGIHTSEYALDIPGGTTAVTIATDFSKSTTYVGLPSDFSFS